MASPVTLVIFEGGVGQSPLEESFRRVRQGVVLDQIVKAQSAGIERIILCTPYPELAEAASPFGVVVELEAPGRADGFHFGRRLKGVVDKGRLQKVLYMGGAAAPLISCTEIASICRLLEEHDEVVTANNFHSADLVGFSPGSILSQVKLPAIDNALPMALVGDAGLRFITLRRSIGLQFDLDTPGDLLVLSVHPAVGEYTRKQLQEIQFDTSRSSAVKRVINDPLGELILCGRIGSPLFEYLDQQTRCRVRVYSEERGMKALGRDEQGEVVSLIGSLLGTLGPTAFFQLLAEAADAAVLDTRVLFAHFRWVLSQSDRFNSDLGLTASIEHPGLRAFTDAAYRAPIPVLLGGHSLVTGGVWGLIDASVLERGAVDA